MISSDTVNNILDNLKGLRLSLALGSVLTYINFFIFITFSCNLGYIDFPYSRS